MVDAHCHISGGDEKVRELLIGRDFFGVHPWESLTVNSGDLAEWLRGVLVANPEAGVGEIGLDRLKEREIPPNMRAVFAAQLEVAIELNRSVVLHGAKCWGQVVREVKRIKEKVKSKQGEIAFLFHGFSRSDGLIPDIVAMNGYISVGPSILNDHAVNYRELVKKIPRERLLVETDRTEESKPISIREVLAKTAATLGISVDELEQVTNENARRFQKNLI